MSVLSKSRSVLVLADEGLQIFYVAGSQVKRVEYISWEDDSFHKIVNNALVKVCRRAPVIILNDMVEQHYRKETIPKVSLMDKANILKRRLSVAFPNYPVRAALKILGKNASAHSYLFAAIPASDPFQKTLFAVRESSVELIGVYLLPIEAAAMVKVLSVKLNKSKRSKPAWTIFVGQHHNGNVRQVVTRDGNLALTRLTPIVDTDVEPELWAKELSGELDATMSYLTRFGYKEADGLDIVIVANNSCQEFLENFITIPSNLHVLSSRETSKILGSPIGAQDDYRYADPVHAAFLGRKTKYSLPMQAPVIQNIIKPRKVARYALVGVLIAFAYFSLDTFQVWQKLTTTSSKLDMVVEQNRSLKLEFDKELEKKKELGFDFVLVNNSIEIFNKIQENRVQPLIVVDALSKSIESDLHLDKLVFEAIAVKDNVGNSYSYNAVPDEEGGEKQTKYLEAVVTLSFPTTLAPEIGVQKVNELQKALQKNLEGYSVEIVKQIADLSYTGNFVGGASGQETLGEKNIEKENYNAEIRVREIVQ